DRVGDEQFAEDDAILPGRIDRGEGGEEKGDVAQRVHDQEQKEGGGCRGHGASSPPAGSSRDPQGLAGGEGGAFQLRWHVVGRHLVAPVEEPPTGRARGAASWPKKVAKLRRTAPAGFPGRIAAPVLATLPPPQTGHIPREPRPALPGTRRLCAP